MFLDDADRIQTAKEQLAARKALFEQNEKRIQEQYAWYPPAVNLFRLDRLEREKFRIEIDEYELETLLEGGENQNEA